MLPNVGAPTRLPVAREMVAPVPRVRFEPFDRAPLVRVSVPLTVTAPLRLIPLARLITRLFKVTAGRAVLAPAPLKVMFAEAPPVRLPLVVEMAPLSVSVLAPIESAPLARVSVALMVGLPFNVTPLALLTVRLFNAATLLGTVMLVELPPKERLEEEVVAKLPAVTAIAGPLSVKVLAPTVKVPLVRVSVPPKVKLLFKVMPLVLLTVRLFRAVTLLGTTMLPELPPQERLEEEVVDKLAGVPVMAGPLSVKVFAPTEKVPLVRVSVLPRARLLFNVTPLALLIVKVLSAVTLLGMFIPVELPPKDKLEVEVVDKLAPVPAMAGPFSVKVWAPTVKFPLVRVSVPPRVKLLFKVTPLPLLTVRLLRAVTLLGMLMPAELPPNDRLEEEVVDKLAGVPAMAGPFNARVLAPTEKVPLVRVSVPPTVTSPPKLMPLALLMVRLFNVTAGRAVLAAVPPKLMFAEAPPVKLPLVVEIRPLSVRVLAPIENAPAVRVSVPLTVAALFRLTPLALLIVKFVTVVNSGPVVCKALPLYSSVELAPQVGAALAVAVPCIERVPLTVTPVMVLAPEPESVRFW